MVASSIPAAVSTAPAAPSTGSATAPSPLSGGASAPVASTANGPQAATASLASSVTDSSTAADFMATLSQLLSAETVPSTEANLPSMTASETSTADSDTSDELQTDAIGDESALVADISQIIGLAQGLRETTATKESATITTSLDTAKTLARAAKSMSVTVDAKIESQDEVADVIAGAVSAFNNPTSGEGASTSDSRGRDKSQFDAAPQVGAGSTLSVENKASNEPRFQSQLHERVGTPAWRDEVGAKLHWMIERGVQSGSLRLSPEHLGPMEVKISVQNDQVSVWFGAAHADTRSALENALPRLREMLATQGMSLADAGVFREPPRDPQQGRGPDTQRYDALGTEGGEAVSGVTSISHRPGLLDAYA